MIMPVPEIKNISNSFIQVTHHHPHSLIDSQPRDIGISITPFPGSDLRPDPSCISADDIPRCPSCSAFFNKFNSSQSHKYRCSLCGSWTVNHFPVDYYGVEHTNEVYDAFVSSKYVYRSTFVPTDYFIISLSLVQNDATIFDALESYISACYQPRQIGIAFLHGSITLIKQRPKIELQTFPDDVPVARAPLFYVNAIQFKNTIHAIKKRIEVLRYIDQPNLPNNIIEFALNVSSPFGTSVHFILDDFDYSSFQKFNDLKSDALKFLRYYIQVSVSVFTNSLFYKNPILDFCSITGGFFKVFPINSIKTCHPETYTMNNETESINNDICEEVKKDLFKLLIHPCYHDAFIFICPPNRSEIDDYAGYGMLKSHTGLYIPKIKAGDTFYFQFSANDCTNPYIQFVIFYTTESGHRKMRVATTPILNHPEDNMVMKTAFSSAMIATRFLIEGKEAALKELDKLKKKFKGQNVFQGAENIINQNTYLHSVTFALMAYNQLYQIPQGQPTFCVQPQTTNQQQNMNQPLPNNTNFHPPSQV